MSSLDNMEHSEITRSQLPNTSLSGSPFLNSKGLKLRKKKVQSKLTFLKNTSTKKIKNSASESVNICDELNSEEGSTEKCTLLSIKDETSSDNAFSENVCSNKEENIVNVCPVCWRKIGIREKISHMKSCAGKHNLTVKQMIDAVDLHNKQLKERKTLGLPCVPTISGAKKLPSRKNPAARDKIDPDLQLGLALSVSMSENEEQQCLMEQEIMLEAGLGDEVAANQASLLEKFGFTSTKPILPSIHARPQSGKQNFKTTPLLLLRTQDERERLITEKVAIILSSEGGSRLNSPSPELQEEVRDNLQSEVLLQLQTKECSLWRKASLTPCSNSNNIYYVEPLGHIITPTKIRTGSKLKHLSQVPCRLKSPGKNSSMDSKRTMSEHTSRSADINPRKRCISNKKKSLQKNLNFDFAIKLSNDWFTLLNNNIKSDLLICVKDEQTIFAHQLILFIRCPKVLQDIEEKCAVKFINWNKISFQSVLAFLSFIYCGSTADIDELHDGLNEVIYLSKKYSVEELCCYLKCCADLPFEANHISTCNHSKDRTSNNDELSGVRDNVSQITLSHRCMAEHLMDMDVHKESRNINVDNIDSVTGSNSSSPICVYSTGRSFFHKESSFSPDPFDDACDREESIIPHDVASSSNTQLNIENLLEVLGNDNETVQSTTCVVTKKVPDKTIVSSDQEENSLKSVNMQQNMSTNIRACKNEPQDKESGINSHGDEFNCEEVLVLRVTNRTIHGVSTVKKKNRETDFHTPVKEETCIDKRKSVRKSLLDVFSSDENNTQCNEANIVNIDSRHSSSMSQSGSISQSDESVSSNGSFHDAVKELPYSQKEITNVGRETSPTVRKETSLNSSNANNAENCFSVHNQNSIGIGNFCADEGYLNFNASGSPLSAPMYQCSDNSNDEGIKTPSTAHRFVGKSVEENYESLFPSTLPRTRCTSDNSMNSDKSLCSPISRNCLSQTSIPLRLANEVIMEQNQIVLSTDNTEIDLLKENSYTQICLQSPETPSADILTAPSISSFSVEVKKNFLERKGDFKIQSCSTPITAVPGTSAVNKQIQSVKAGESCVTPMADYSGMDTPMLERELKKYGLKPLKRKRAKQILTHIYDKLHPLVPVDQVDDELSAKRSQGSVMPMTSPGKGSLPVMQGDGQSRNLIREKETSGNEYSFSSSQGSSSSLCEFEGPEDPLEEASISEIDKSVLHTAVYNFIKRDPNIHKQALLYEPIWVELLQDALKAENHKFKLNQLLQFLDDECITYRSTQGGSKRQKKKKKVEKKKGT